MGQCMSRKAAGAFAASAAAAHNRPTNMHKHRKLQEVRKWFRIAVGYKNSNNRVWAMGKIQPLIF